MKTAKRITAILLAVIGSITLCVCDSGIPEQTGSCFDGAARNSASGAVLTARMAAGGKKSEKTAGISADALTGTWKGEVDVSPVICESFESIEGLELQKKLGAVIIPMTLTFTDDGYYIMKFSEKDIDKAVDKVRKCAADAAKDYLSASGKLGKVVMMALGEDTLEDVIGYAVALVRQMLVNGAAGTYKSSGGRICFDSKYSYDAILTSRNLTLSGSSGQGMLKCLNAAPVNFTKG